MTLSPVARAALVLGLLSAVGPFAIDMFLPALPAIAADLGASITATQGTITYYFMAFGIAQMVYGPWSDQIGRRVPIFTGLSIFMAGSIAATLAPTIGLLIAARIAQGFGAAALMVVTRAIIRDQFTGYDATRLMSLVMLVFSVSPMFAPIAGAGFVATTGWRMIFAAMGVSALLALLLTAFFQPETLKPAHRVPVNFGTIKKGLGVLFRDPYFLGLTFIGGFGFAAFMIFISSAAFIYDDVYGLTPTQFSFIFAINAMGFIGASQAAPKLMQKYGATRLIAFGVTGAAIVLPLLFAVFTLGLGSFWALCIGIFVSFAFMGLVIPTAMVACLDPHGEIAGLASSLGGTLQMVTGGVMVAISGPFFDGTPTPMIAAMAVCCVAAFILVVLMRKPTSAQTEAQN